MQVARATEVERAATGGPAPVLKVDSVPRVRRDSLAGLLTYAEQRALEMWEHCVTTIENDPMKLEREVDWVIKHNLIEAYRRSITDLDWMTEETKQRAFEKLATFRPKIGYPNKWRDYSRVEIKPEPAGENPDGSRLTDVLPVPGLVVVGAEAEALGVGDEPAVGGRLHL